MEAFAFYVYPVTLAEFSNFSTTEHEAREEKIQKNFEPFVSAVVKNQHNNFFE